MSHGRHSGAAQGGSGGHRHGGGNAAGGRSHGHAGFNAAAPVDPLYGSNIDAEAIGQNQIPPASITEDNLRPYADGNVIIDKDGITITDGRLTLTSSDGTTVIIDGTSNMFKIMASGSLEVTVAHNTVDADVVTLSGLGAQTVTPGCLGYVSLANTYNTLKYPMAYAEMERDSFVANASGGSPTDRILGAEVYSFIGTALDASDYIQVYLGCTNTSGASVTRYCSKYYVLIEASF